MTVRYLETGETAEVNDCYGARLVEQRKAVPAPEKKTRKTKAKAEEKSEGDA